MFAKCVTVTRHTIQYMNIVQASLAMISRVWFGHYNIRRLYGTSGPAGSSLTGSLTRSLSGVWFMIGGFRINYKPSAARLDMYDNSGQIDYNSLLLSYCLEDHNNALQEAVFFRVDTQRRHNWNGCVLSCWCIEKTQLERLCSSVLIHREGTIGTAVFFRVDA
jgi:hypothetical protein